MNPLFTFCYRASGPDPGKKQVTPMNEYPREANCCINSSCINKEINSIKSSVVFCRGCAHHWLGAQCQKPRGNCRNGSRRYPDPQTRWRACLASVYDSLPKERKSWKGGVCSFLLGGWQEQGKKKWVGCGCEESNEFPRPPLPPSAVAGRPAPPPSKTSDAASLLL